MASGRIHHRVLIVGGGSAGVSVGARLRRSGVDDIGIIDPAESHYYQPLWTLVGGGRAPVKESVRPEASVLPQGTAWIKDRAEDVDPENRVVTTAAGTQVSYDYLVMCPGIQLDWGRVSGMADALRTPAVSSNYTYETAPKTWELMRGVRRGTAVFTHPSGPIKCAGAPQKIAYLCADYWRREGVLGDIRVVLVLPTPAMFGQPDFSAVLDKVAQRYGIEVHLNSELTEVDPDGRRAVVVNNSTDEKTEIDYSAMHVTPPQSAPDWIKRSPLADAANPNGYVEIDKHTMQHARYPNVFSLGDAGSSPNSKTGAAIRKQAPVVTQNLLAVMNEKTPSARYDGYASCPLTTARDRMLLAEFDYTMKMHPTIPFIDTTQERYDMWLLKRYGLPFMYWNLMLKGMA